MSMLTELTVERFKSIRKVKLLLGRVNLFIGGNGSGKSNVLEAIGVLSAAVDRGIGDSDLSRKGVRITPPELMKSAFKKYDLPRTLQITAKMTEDVTYRINLSGKPDDPMLSFFSELCTHHERKIFGRSPNGVRVQGRSISRSLSHHRSIWDQVRTAFEFPAAVEEALNALSAYAIYLPQTDFLRGMQAGRVDTPPIGLHGEGLPQAVHGLMSQLSPYGSGEDASAQDLVRKAIRLAFLPSWAHAVRVGPIEKHLTSRALLDQGEDMVYFVDKYMHNKRKNLSVYDSSEGTLFLLFAAILLCHNDSPKIFALDNVDNALNPRMTRSLLETIIDTTKKSCLASLSCGPRQVFLTSHNPTSLDAFDLFDEDQRVFVVRRNDEGHTVVDRLQPRRDMSKHDWYESNEGRNLSQLWLDGEIDGALGETL